jgi:hypothetical protein
MGWEVHPIRYRKEEAAVGRKLARANGVPFSAQMRLIAREWMVQRGHLPEVPVKPLLSERAKKSAATQRAQWAQARAELEATSGAKG